jgi:hypothetical protein
MALRSSKLANDLQIGTTFEHGVIGDEHKPTPHGSRSDPQVTVVNLLVQRMPGTLACNPEVGERGSRQIVGWHHVRRPEQSFKPLQSPLSPSSADRTKARLGDNLRGDDDAPSGHVRPIPGFQS